MDSLNRHEKATETLPPPMEGCEKIPHISDQRGEALPEFKERAICPLNAAGPGPAMV
jgi:hypothetical protein